jgi:hypothetical protein
MSSVAISCNYVFEDEDRMVNTEAYHIEKAKFQSDALVSRRIGQYIAYQQAAASQMGRTTLDYKRKRKTMQKLAR